MRRHYNNPARGMTAERPPRPPHGRTARTTLGKPSTCLARVLALDVKLGAAMKRRPPHPLEHHPSFRAVIAAAPPVAELARELAGDGRELVGTLAIVCGDL